MTKAEYAAYLESDHWKNLRAAKIKRDGAACKDCGSTRFIQVHHLNYRNIFDVILDDLKVVCRVCHEKIHGIIKPKPAPAKPQRQTAPRIQKDQSIRWVRIYGPSDIQSVKFANKLCIEAPLTHPHFLGLNFGRVRAILRKSKVHFDCGPTPLPRKKMRYYQPGQPLRAQDAPEVFNPQAKQRPKRPRAKIYHPVFYSRPKRPKWVNRGNSCN